MVAMAGLAAQCGACCLRLVVVERGIPLACVVAAQCGEEVLTEE
jgi:hypothetical protein